MQHVQVIDPIHSWICEKRGQQQPKHAQSTKHAIWLTPVAFQTWHGDSLFAISCSCVCLLPPPLFSHLITNPILNCQNVCTQEASCDNVITLRHPIARPNTTVTNKSLNISAFLARRDTWFGMGDFFVSP